MRLPVESNSQLSIPSIAPPTLKANQPLFFKGHQSVGRQNNHNWKSLLSPFAGLFGVRRDTGICRVAELDTRKRRVALEVLGTGRRIWVKYRDEFQGFFQQHVGELVEIHGDIVSNKDDNPIFIINITNTYLVDTSDIEIRLVTPDGLKLITKEKTVISVELGEHGQIYIASIDYLQMYSGAYTRQELIEEIKSEIAYSWQNIVMEKNENLAEGGLCRKELMLRMYEEVRNATRSTKNNKKLS